MEEIRKFLEKHGVPGRDLYELPTSEKRFSDGCHYRIEVSGVERPSTLEALIDEMEKRRVPVHRIISMVMGATLLSDDELESFARMARDAKLEVIVTPGPRTIWDLGGKSRRLKECFLGCASEDPTTSPTSSQT